MPIDAKQTMGVKYRTYRILRSNPIWASIYLERVREFGDYRGIIIFPDTFLLLTSEIFAVTSKVTRSSVTMSISTLSPGLIIENHNNNNLYSFEPVNTIEQLIEWQDSCTTPDTTALLRTFPGDRLRFEFSSMVPFFSNKESAVAYMNKRTVQSCKTL
jgi:hypothetical protein